MGSIGPKKVLYCPYFLPSEIMKYFIFYLIWLALRVLAWFNRTKIACVSFCFACLYLTWVKVFKPGESIFTQSRPMSVNLHLFQSLGCRIWLSTQVLSDKDGRNQDLQHSECQDQKKLYCRESKSALSD